MIKTRDELRSQFKRLQIAAEGTFHEITDKTTTRKEFAFEALKDKELSPLLFALYDKKSLDEIIWKKLRPGAQKIFKEEI